MSRHRKKYGFSDIYRFIPIDSIGRGYIFVIVSEHFDIFDANLKSLYSDKNRLFEFNLQKSEKGRKTNILNLPV